MNRLFNSTFANHETVDRSLVRPNGIHFWRSVPLWECFGFVSVAFVLFLV